MGVVTGGLTPMHRARSLRDRRFPRTGRKHPDPALRPGLLPRSTKDVPRKTRPKTQEEAPFLITPPRKKGKPPLPEPVAPKPGKPSLAYLQEQRR